MNNNLRVSENLIAPLLWCGLAVLFGIGASFALSSPKGAKALLLVACLPFVVAASWNRKDWTAAAIYLALYIIEEFPTNLIVEKRWDRAITLIYGKSVGIPGLFGTDIMMIACLVIFAGSIIIKRKNLPYKNDSIIVPLAATCISIAISAIISLFIFPDTTTTEALNTSETGIDMKQAVAPLIAYFQFKTWFYVYLSYLATRAVLVNMGRIRWFFKIYVIGIAVSVGIGIYRLFFYLKKLSPSKPLFYDDSTLFLFLVFIVFFVLSWGRRLFPKKHFIWQFLLVCAAMGIILLSFRRAIWLGCVLSFLATMMFIPMWLKIRLASAAMILILISGIVMTLAGFDYSELLGKSSSSSATQMRTSAIYRMALFYNMLKLNHFSLWGYGVKPLWNLPLIMGSFSFNFENVHNLYYWFVLRTGVAGISTFFYLVYRIFRDAWILRRDAYAPWCAVIAETLMIAFMLLLLMGWFHPTYAMARFVIFFGILLAVLMAVKSVNREYLLKGGGS